MHWISPSLWLLPLLALASCGGGGAATRADVVFEPAGGDFAERFAQRTRSHGDGVLLCSAEVERVPKDQFGIDLASRFDVIPVLVRINLVDRVGVVNLTPRELQPVLFLENGTALESVDYTELREELPEKLVTGFSKRSLKAKTLQRGSDLEVRGYLYFALPDGARRRGDEISVAGAHGSAYHVDLSRSLLRFNYTHEADGTSSDRTILVGTD